MTDTFRIEIAGVCFAVELADNVRIIEIDPIYQTFLKPTAGPLPRIDVAVDLRFDQPPELAALPLLFDTGESWVAHADGDAVILSMPALQGRDGLMWSARLQPDCHRVSLFCGEDLVDRVAGEILVANPLCYPLDQLLLMFVLAEEDGVIVHAAGVTNDGVGALFAGRSGAGKTTLMRQIQDYAGLYGLSDDRVVVRAIGRDLWLCGTPWAGEGRVAANRAVPFGAVVLLHKAEVSHLEPISPGEAVLQLLPTTSVLWFDQQRMTRSLDFCEQMVETVGAWELHFAPEPEVGNVVAELLTSV